MGTAEEHVYSAWQEQAHRRRDERKTLYRDRFAPKKIHLLRSVGGGTELPKRVESGTVAQIPSEAAADGRSRGGNDGQHAVLLRGGCALRGSSGGGRSEPVSRDQPLDEKDGPP